MFAWLFFGGILAKVLVQICLKLIFSLTSPILLSGENFSATKVSGGRPCSALRRDGSILHDGIPCPERNPPVVRLRRHGRRENRDAPHIFATAKGIRVHASVFA